VDRLANLMRSRNPRSIAIVGASERRQMWNVAMANLEAAVSAGGVDLHLVNPGAAGANDRPTSPSLAALGAPVDAEPSLVGADRMIGVVEDAGAIGAAGGK